MLTLNVELEELFDDNKNEFVEGEKIELKLEHSLVSLSKWESIHKKPFLSNTMHTDEEIFSYIECMIINEKYPKDILYKLREPELTEINDYLSDSKTATTFYGQDSKKSGGETITAELMYYWMFTLGIPIDCENWHLSKLLTTIKVFNVKNQDPKKMSRSEIAARNRELNAKRKAELGTTG